MPRWGVGVVLAASEPRVGSAWPIHLHPPSLLDSPAFPEDFLTVVAKDEAVRIRRVGRHVLLFTDLKLLIQTLKPIVPFPPSMIFAHKVVRLGIPTLDRSGAEASGARRTSWGRRPSGR